MKLLSILSLVVVLFSALAGCGGNESRPSAATEAPGPTGPDSHLNTTMEVEIGCAACTYGMDGIKRCITAAKVDDTAMLVQGGGVDAHQAGLCKAPRNATLVGHVHDGTLMATSITLH